MAPTAATIGRVGAGWTAGSSGRTNGGFGDGEFGHDGFGDGGFGQGGVDIGTGCPVVAATEAASGGGRGVIGRGKRRPPRDVKT